MPTDDLFEEEAPEGGSANREDGTTPGDASDGNRVSDSPGIPSEVIKTVEDARKVVERIAKSGAAGGTTSSARSRAQVERDGDRAPAPDRSKIDLDWLMRRAGKKGKKK